jgi:hypothetical protein
MRFEIESLRVQFPVPWGEGWLKASRLKSAVNTPQLAAGCFIGRCQKKIWANELPLFGDSGLSS